MKYLTILLMILNITACSKKQPYVQIADQIKSDIIVVEQQIQDIKDNLPTECKNTTVKANLSTIQANLKTIKVRVEEQVLVCDDKRKILEEKIGKLEAFLVALVLLVIILLYIIVKKR